MMRRTLSTSLWVAASAVLCACGAMAPSRSAEAPPMPDASAAPKVTSTDEDRGGSAAPNGNVLEEEGSDGFVSVDVSPSVEGPLGGRAGDTSSDKASLSDATGGGSPIRPVSPAPAAATGDAVHGRVDPKDVEMEVAKQRSAFSACLREDSVVEIEVKVSPTGEIVDAWPVRSIPDEPKVRDCVVANFRKLRLPPLSPSVSAKAHLTLMLKKGR